MSFWSVGVLVLAVMVVNGWTDAPNAIASVVATDALPFRRAVVLAAACDFLGALTMCLICPTVAETVYELADFGGNPAAALIALRAAFLAIVFWSVLAWRFGVPTSESHALLAGITGASVALYGGFWRVNAAAWGKVAAGLVLSTVCGALAGRLAAGVLARRRLSARFVRRGQLAGAAATAFFHGAQDGQKFIALFLLCRALSRGEGGRTFVVSLPVCALCAGCMALGTAAGGRRIIDSLTRDLTGLTPEAGLAADLGGGACLLAASVFGLPVSTTHTKISSIWGAGTAQKKPASCSGIRDVVLTWIATFPGCFLLAWGLTKAFLL